MSTLTLIASKTALLVIDLQNDTISVGGKSEKSGAVEHAKSQRTVEHVSKLLTTARTVGSPVFHNLFVVEPGAPAIGTNAPIFASIQAGGNVVKGTWGAAIVDGIKVAEGEYVLERQRMDAFHGTQLNVLLRNLGIDTVIICGAWTNMAVEHTARSAADYGYRVVLASDATSTFNDRWQQASLNYALTNIATLASTAEIEAALRTTEQGLKGQYYQGPDLLGEPILTRTDPKIDFQERKNFRVEVEPFSVRWTGTLHAPVSGTYTFQTRHDDGVRLWVNNVGLINDWERAGTREKTGEIRLEAGRDYDVVLDYFQFNYDAVMQLSWQYPCKGMHIIPQDFFQPKAAPSHK
jgi:ureidoacrylate peracid hydrolase